MNAIVFAPRTSPEIAARQLCAEMLSRGDTPMPDPAALADALTRAACRAAENLIDNAGSAVRRQLARHRHRPRRPPCPDHATPAPTRPRRACPPCASAATRREPLPRNTARAFKPGCCGPAGPTLSAAKRAANSDPPPPVGVRSAVMVSCPVAAALSVEEDANMPATTRTVAQVEFYWPGYDPEKAIDLFEDTPIESFTPRQGVQIDYPGATTGAVYKWMSIHDLACSAPPA